MIDKETFCEVIEKLRQQIHFNKSNCLKHNRFLIESIMILLRVHFPKDKDDFCHIEHYCFHLDFGKLGNELLITTEDLYDELISKTNKS